MRVALPAKLAVSDFDVLVAAAAVGLGIALLPDFMCLRDLRAGTLQRVLPHWEHPDVPFHVVYPSNRHLSPTVRSFVDHVQEQLSPPPWERDPAV